MLTKLLADYISKQDPTMCIIVVFGWPLEEVKKMGGYRPYLKQKGWVEGRKTVFIFDEAQVSYEDAELWGVFFKSIHEYAESRAIAFASYGSPSSRITIKGTPLTFHSMQRVTLHPIDHLDGLPPVGLFFSRVEFDELISKLYPSPEYYFDSSFFDAVFGLTEDHVGAICDFVSIVAAHDVGFF